ncbi:MAG TPA: DUF4440 domain-containing protein [Thermoanaerobaculia bacterium]|jgi:ketosteroid isomerase-like protein|nr:DUF4440 domain-containing protein [Thermoanaerobaculia bacterium]
MSTNDAEAAIRAAEGPFIAAFNAGDWATVSSYYADDAVTLMPNTDVARGRPAIQQLFSSMGPMKPNLSFGPDRIVQSCDVAYEIGHYQMRMTGPNGSPMNDAGKYLTVWRRMPDGTWKIVADMINTNQPPPAM